MRVVRALSGTVAAGLVVLAAVVVGAAVLGVRRGFPGPGASSVGWHIGMAALALGAQIFPTGVGEFRRFSDLWSSLWRRVTYWLRNGGIDLRVTVAAG